MKIAVYGTLRKRYGNHRLIEGSKFIGAGLTDEKHTLFASGIPFVQKGGGTHQVRVEVYEVEESDVPRVDSLEGHPEWYRREETPITLDDGTKLDAWLYFMPGVEKNSSRLTLIESGDYADYARW